jgi:DNA polymerase-3 subunit delta
MEEVRAPSLFGGPTIVVVRRAEALREESQARILATLPLLGDSGCLIMIAAAGDQRRRLFAACAEAGAAYGFPAPDAAGVQAWVGRLAQESGHAIAPAAVRELLDRCGGELAVLAGEIEKLTLHIGGGGRIEVEHVRALVGAARGHAVEALTERLARRDFGGATHCLRQLLADGEPPIRLLAFLAANVRRALHVVELGEQGLTPADIGRRLGMPDWLVGRNLRRGSTAALARMLNVLRRLDQELKSTRPTEAVFEEALREMRCCGGARPW